MYPCFLGSLKQAKDASRMAFGHTIRGMHRRCSLLQIWKYVDFVYIQPHLITGRPWLVFDCFFDGTLYLFF